MTPRDQMFDCPPAGSEDWPDNAWKKPSEVRRTTLPMFARRCRKQISQWIVRWLSGETTQEAYVRGRSDAWSEANRLYRK